MATKFTKNHNTCRHNKISLMKLLPWELYQMQHLTIWKVIRDPMMDRFLTRNTNHVRFLSEENYFGSWEKLSEREHEFFPTGLAFPRRALYVIIRFCWHVEKIVANLNGIWHLELSYHMRLPWTLSVSKSSDILTFLSGLHCIWPTSSQSHHDLSFAPVSP